MNSDGYLIFRFEEEDAAQIATVVKDETKDALVKASYHTGLVPGSSNRIAIRRPGNQEESHSQ